MLNLGWCSIYLYAMIFPCLTCRNALSSPLQHLIQIRIVPHAPVLLLSRPSHPDHATQAAVQFVGRRQRRRRGTLGHHQRERDPVCSRQRAHDHNPWIRTRTRARRNCSRRVQ
ncbi:hypothetical protein BC828DRAFT_374461 [Blastocladiella britannica]|nr:hypothetical protein BC828DRAFT_374461 [Blastocladiella britannica]